MTSPSARIALHLLAGASAPIPARTLAASIGVRPPTLQATISHARKALVDTGARIIPVGSGPTLAYRMEGIDPAGIEALVGPPPKPALYSGFREGAGRILAALKAAAGTPVPLPVLTREMCGYAGPEAIQRAREIMHRIRAAMAEDGSAETAVPVGTDAFAWRSGATEPDRPSDEAVAVSFITLPSVGGEYRYAAGRLYLEGRALPVRVGA